MMLWCWQHPIIDPGQGLTAELETVEKEINILEKEPQ